MRGIPRIWQMYERNRGIIYFPALPPSYLMYACFLSNCMIQSLLEKAVPTHVVKKFSAFIEPADAPCSQKSDPGPFHWASLDLDIPSRPIKIILEYGLPHIRKNVTAAYYRWNTCIGSWCNKASYILRCKYASMHDKYIVTEHVMLSNENIITRSSDDRWGFESVTWFVVHIYSSCLHYHIQISVLSHVAW